MAGECYIGVMSGTSLDGVDAVLVDFADGGCRLLGAVAQSFPPALRATLAALQSSDDDELVRAARAGNALADIYAAAILELLAVTGTPAAEVLAAGVHGQTLRHRPEEAWTWQLNNPARVAEQTGITIVADFRSRDVAAGGQGAPLVPAFHAARFRSPTIYRVIVNIGGIANVTDLPPRQSGAGEGERFRSDAAVRGFDTGPGNVLLDLWCMQHRGESYDRDGAWATSGRLDQALLEHFLSEPFFALPPPKSTGRDLFERAWLEARLGEYQRTTGASPSPADVQASLLALTVSSIAAAIERDCSAASEVLLCGGGANNHALRQELASALGGRPVATTAQEGVAVEQVEALAFAWLAREALAGRAGNLPAVTGARGARILGAIYPR